MFCPNCGANNTTEQSFCRSCGLNLEPTAESLLEQIPSAESANLLRHERNLQKFGDIAMAGLGLVLLTGVGAIIYVIFNQLIWSGKNIFAGVLFIGFIIFAVLTLAYVILKEDLKERKQKTNPALANKTGGPRDTAKLLEEKPFEPIPSVTENSTELLFAERKPKTSGDLR